MAVLAVWAKLVSEYLSVVGNCNQRLSVLWGFGNFCVAELG
jgi:hypothetical protein